MDDQRKAAVAQPAEVPAAAGRQKATIEFELVGGLRPKNLDEAWRMCDAIARADTTPKAFKGKQADILLAFQKGAELGIAPAAALSSFAVIHGNLTIFGDGLLAVVLSQPDLAPEHPKEWMEGEPYKDDWTAHCEIKRGQRTVRASFSYAEARMAGLLETESIGRDGKPYARQSAWLTYPRRMLIWRARGFAARDAFADRFVGVRTDIDPPRAPRAMRDVVGGETVERPKEAAVTGRIDAGLMEAVAKDAEDAEFVEVATEPAAEQPAEQPAAAEDAEFDLAPPADQDPAYRRLLAAIAKHDREAAMLLIRDGVAGDAVRTLAEGDDEALPELLRHIMDTPPGMGKETIVWIGQAEVPEAAKSEMVELLRRVEGQ